MAVWRYDSMAVWPALTTKTAHSYHLYHQTKSTGNWNWEHNVLTGFDSRQVGAAVYRNHLYQLGVMFQSHNSKAMEFSTRWTETQGWFFSPWLYRPNRTSYLRDQYRYDDRSAHMYTASSCLQASPIPRSIEKGNWEKLCVGMKCQGGVGWELVFRNAASRKRRVAEPRGKTEF